MDRALDVHRVANFQCRVDRCRRRAPVLVQLQAHRAGLHLFDQGRREARVAFAEKPEIHREGFGCLEHAADMPRTRRACGRQGAGRGPGAAADHGGHARHQRLVDLLRADEVDVRVDAAGGHDHALAGNDFGPGADGDVDPGLDVGVAGLAEAGDPPFLDRKVAFNDAPPVDHQRIGDHRVGAIFRHTLALAHAVADDLAAAKFDFLTVDREVLLDLDDQLGVGEAYPIADRWPEHFDIGAATDLHRFASRSTSAAGGGTGSRWPCSGPLTAPAKPWATGPPPNPTRFTPPSSPRPETTPGSPARLCRKTRRPAS